MNYSQKIQHSIKHSQQSTSSLVLNSHHSSVTIKFLLALSALVPLASAGNPEGCDDCTAVVMTLSAFLSSQESFNNQVDILLAEVCPQAQMILGQSCHGPMARIL